MFIGLYIELREQRKYSSPDTLYFRKYVMAFVANVGVRSRRHDTELNVDRKEKHGRYGSLELALSLSFTLP